MTMETCVNERERDKNAARRLAVLRHAEEVTGNVALTCRYYGITRQAFYLWRRRYEAEGPAGLRDRSKRPQSCPHETPTEIVGKIIYLRQNYHFGAHQDRDVPEAVPRHPDQRLRRVADPQTAGHEPAAGLAAVQVPRPQVETV
jgi:transposase-like protein